MMKDMSAILHRPVPESMPTEACISNMAVLQQGQSLVQLEKYVIKVGGSRLMQSVHPALMDHVLYWCRA